MTWQLNWMTCIHVWIKLDESLKFLVSVLLLVTSKTSLLPNSRLM